MAWWPSSGLVVEAHTGPMEGERGVITHTEFSEYPFGPAVYIRWDSGQFGRYDEIRHLKPVYRPSVWERLR